MNITQHFDFDRGLAVISPQGLQKYTERLDSYSQILTQLYVSSANNINKYCIDSCWESGNIYYVSYDNGYVKKIQFDGTEIASLSLVNPLMVSVIQYSTGMSVTVNFPPQNDQGCWIADKGSGKIIKTDNNLNIMAELEGIDNPVALIADIDGGCYVVEEHTFPSVGGNLIKVSSDAEVLGVKPYSSFSPSVVKFIDIAVDSAGWVWFCADDKLFNLTYSSGQLNQQYVLNPLGSDDPFSSSSSEPFIEETKHIGSIDTDRNNLSRHLYVAGGNGSEAFILKYNPESGSLLARKQYYDISFPYIVKVVQGMGSDSLYILEDSAKWDDYGYGSSSSSSSSSSTEWKSSSSSSSKSSSTSESSSSSSSL